MYFRFACYMADNEIAMSYFTHDNHFLLVASRTGKGLAQLCMYEASKGQVHVADEGATGDDTNGTRRKQNKKNAELKGNERKASQDTDSERAKDKKATGKGAKTKNAPKGKTEHVKADSGECDTSKVRDELGPTLEKQYLDMLADEEDVYGQPKKFNLKEEEKEKDTK